MAALPTDPFATRSRARSARSREAQSTRNPSHNRTTWEDGVGPWLGITIGLTPWFYDEAVVPTVVLNSTLTGLAVLALAQLEIVILRKWEEFANWSGAWLIVSPFIFDYAHQDRLRYWHWVLGGTVSVLAAFEIWQDWSVSDKAR
jgi:hypothetical protein